MMGSHDLISFQVINIGMAKNPLITSSVVTLLKQNDRNSGVAGAPYLARQGKNIA